MSSVRVFSLYFAIQLYFRTLLSLEYSKHFHVQTQDECSQPGIQGLIFMGPEAPGRSAALGGHGGRQG